MSIAVSDSFSNRPEHIQESARVVGRSLARRAVYTEVYRGQKRVKTVSEIAEKTALDRKAVLNRGRELERGGVIRSTRRDGEQAYEQIPEQLHIKDKVLRIAGDAKGVAAIVTKRTPIIATDLFTIKRKASPRRVKGRSSRSLAIWRVAFLSASPIGHAPLNVSIEAREIENERRKADASDQFEFKVFPAADPDSLLDAINNFRPHVIHFAGHGGGAELVLDNQHVTESGGTFVNFKAFARILGTAPFRPKLLVLNACDTVVGADMLTAVADIVLAMADSIADSSAYHFSRRLYAALFAGLHVSAAYEQAVAALSIDNVSDSQLPTLLTSDSVDASKIAFR